MTFARNIVLFVTILILAGLVFSSLAIAIVTSLLKGNFDGHCPLYATATKKEDHKIYLAFNTVSNCNYVIALNFVAVALAVIIGVFRGRELLKKNRASENVVVSFFLGVVCFVLVFLMLVAACIVSVGFKALCGELISQEPELKCVQFEKFTSEEFDPSNFYTFLNTAQIASWLNVPLWLFVGISSILLFICWKPRAPDTEVLT
ncbi:transmembrane protein 179B-like [Diadema antillarum]|uniref:transmembrane protein 179B-like n=1 Tax=Diadema antillarum TaxID=105358 RepID=UPI003A8A4426